MQASFQALALFFRSVPHGSGFEREQTDYESFVLTAHIGLVGVMALALLSAAVLGYVLAPRQASHRGRISLATTAAGLAFIVVTLPFVEFLSACNVGEPLVLGASC